MFDALFSIFGSLILPSQNASNFRAATIPSYPKTVEEAFRKDWEAIGADMYRAIEKVKTDVETQHRQV